MISDPFRPPVADPSPVREFTRSTDLLKGRPAEITHKTTGGAKQTKALMLKADDDAAADGVE